MRASRTASISHHGKTTRAVKSSPKIPTEQRALLSMTLPDLDRFVSFSVECIVKEGYQSDGQDVYLERGVLTDHLWHPRYAY